MKLDHARIANGDCLLFCGRAPWSRAIEDWTPIYSHAALAVCWRLPHERVPFAVEAVEGKGVRAYPLRRYLRECAQAGCTIDWFALKPPAAVVFDPDVASLDPQEDVASFALAQIGDSYAAEQLAWSFILRRFLGRLFRKPTSKDEWFCSELVAAAYRAAGYAIEAEPADMAPADLSKLPFLEFRASLEMK